MFGIGFFEICIIVAAALIFVGPKKLPELMSQFGKFFVQMRRVSNEVKTGFDSVIREAEEEVEREERAALKKAREQKSQETSVPPLSVDRTLHKKEEQQSPLV